MMMMMMIMSLGKHFSRTFIGLTEPNRSLSIGYMYEPECVIVCVVYES